MPGAAGGEEALDGRGHTFGRQSSHRGSKPDILDYRYAQTDSR
ncbi:hypothetical protein [Streptomyces sp. SID4920]|nr:hypothetical protein [Streptomyces sp. SID4920]